MLLPSGGYFDPANRNLNFGAQNVNAHSIRMNGTVELPIGPNKLLFGGAFGWMGRLLERWQTSFILNAANGNPISFSPGIAHFYESSRYNVTKDWIKPHGQVEWNVRNPTTGAITGSFFGNPSPFMGVTDPQCSGPKIVTQGDRMGTNLGVANPATGTPAVCTIFALAKRNPDGTQGEYLLTYPMPGQVRNSGNANFVSFGQWDLDMNASKTFRISESKSFQLRVDATNVLNHPVPNALTVNASNLGAINGKGNQTRQLQAQLRISI